MLEIKFSPKISEIDKALWNSLCPEDYPFCRYEFLYALEESGSVSAKTGWQPIHLQLQDNGITVAIMPLYLKNHSYGEYVFDWAWADAYHHHGLEYYPKLVNAIPYSPVTGPRLLTQQNPEPLVATIKQMLPQICHKLNANSWHCLFPTSQLTEQLDHPTLMIRHGCQYQWINQGYTSFEDFLSRFNSRKRKNVKKERKKIVDQGISHIQLTGDQITDEQLDIFYEFYRMTYLKRGREAYLEKAFFSLLLELMPENILLVLAYYDDQPVAGALSLHDNTTLYGRYWGCFDEYDSLHFETCYYQGIDFCIEKQLKRFDSGAQGEHKIQRGFEPLPTWSAHWLKEKGFNQAIQTFIEEEQEMIKKEMIRLSSYLPFRKE